MQDEITNCADHAPLSPAANRYLILSLVPGCVLGQLTTEPGWPGLKPRDSNPCCSATCQVLTSLPRLRINSMLGRNLPASHPWIQLCYHLHQPHPPICPGSYLYISCRSWKAVILLLINNRLLQQYPSVSIILLSRRWGTTSISCPLCLREVNNHHHQYTTLSQAPIATMTSFISGLFSASTRQERPESMIHRPVTPGSPNKDTHNFITPISTPQGSPSKKTVPPGANELSEYFDNFKLSSGAGNSHPLDAPVKLTPPTKDPRFSPGKINNHSNIRIFEDSPAGSNDQSIIQKPAPAAAPRQQHTQENTPPASRRPPIVGQDSAVSVLQPSQPSHAASARQEFYHLRERDSRPATPIKKFNTNRGLTAEERELLAKPNVKRMVNVTQLCMLARSPGGSLMI